MNVHCTSLRLTFVKWTFIIREMCINIMPVQFMLSFVTFLGFNRKLSVQVNHEKIPRHFRSFGGVREINHQHFWLNHSHGTHLFSTPDQPLHIHLGAYLLRRKAYVLWQGFHVEHMILDSKETSDIWELATPKFKPRTFTFNNTKDLSFNSFGLVLIRFTAHQHNTSHIAPEIIWKCN